MSVEVFPVGTIDNGRRWDFFVLYIDLYKHHFDLFVKGYLVYLVIIGTAAGLAFGQGTDPIMRVALMYLVISISFIATAAWASSFFFAWAVGRQIHKLCGELKIPYLPMFGVKVIVLVATLGSAIFTAGGFYVLLTLPVSAIPPLP